MKIFLSLSLVVLVVPHPIFQIYFGEEKKKHEERRTLSLKITKTKIFHLFFLFSFSSFSSFFSHPKNKQKITHLIFNLGVEKKNNLKKKIKNFSGTLWVERSKRNIMSQQDASVNCTCKCIRIGALERMQRVARSGSENKSPLMEVQKIEKKIIKILLLLLKNLRFIAKNLQKKIANQKIKKFFFCISLNFFYSLWKAQNFFQLFFSFFKKFFYLHMKIQSFCMFLHGSFSINFICRKLLMKLLMQGDDYLTVVHPPGC